MYVCNHFPLHQRISDFVLLKTLGILLLAIFIYMCVMVLGYVCLRSKAIIL